METHLMSAAGLEHRLKEHEHVYIRQKRSVGSAGNKLIRREIHGAISEGKALMRFIYETL